MVEIKKEVIIGVIIFLLTGITGFIVNDYIKMHQRISKLEAYIENNLPEDPSQIVLNQHIKDKLSTVEVNLNNLIIAEGSDDAHKQMLIMEIKTDIGLIKGVLGL